MTLDDHTGHRSAPRRIDSEPDPGTGITARPRHIESERTHFMILTHTDAHEIFVPDRFKDEETGMGYDVRHDDDEPDPRDAWMVPADATGLTSAVHIFGSDHYNQSVDRSVPAHPAIRAFMYFWGRHDGDQDAIGTALHLTRRYLRIWHPGLRTKIVAGHFDVDQSTWYDIVAASDPDTWGEPQGLIDQFLAWARGDVWGVIPDEGESLWGIYADSPENALRIFRDQEESDAAPTAVEEPVPAPPAHWRVHLDLEVGSDPDDDQELVSAAVRAAAEQIGRVAGLSVHLTEREIQVGDLVAHRLHPELDYRRVIARGTDWVWLDFQTRQLDAGQTPTRLPLSNYVVVR